MALLAAPGVTQAQERVDAQVPMRDGVKLVTEIYLPAGAGPFPAVLIRSPYGVERFRDSADGYNDMGVAMVAQAMRGVAGSEGEPCVFSCDGDGALGDGPDTVAWIRSQPWSDGQVVGAGSSAQGMALYLMAPAAPEGLKALWVSQATQSFYDHVAFPGGIFKESLINTWLSVVGAGHWMAHAEAHPLMGPEWRDLQPSERLDKVDVPAIHVAGWFDVFLQGNLDAYEGWQRRGGPRARGAQRLIIGPWAHLAWEASRQGDLRFPEDNVEIPGGGGKLRRAFLAQALGLDPDPPALRGWPTVRYYLMGAVDEPGAPGNEWRDADDWPLPAAPTRWRLQAGGGLAEACPGEQGGTTEYSYDPADPVPTVGGSNLVLPTGPTDHAAVEARDDVLTFTTPPLEAPLEIVGRVRARVHVSIDQPDTDVFVRLLDVYPDGRSISFMEGGRRLASRNRNDTLEPLSPGEVVEADVDLWSTALVLNAGHRLRVSVTSSNSPRHRASANDGAPFGQPASPRPVGVTVHHDDLRPSYIELPLPGRAGETVSICQPPPSPSPAEAAGCATGRPAWSPRLWPRR